MENVIVNASLGLRPLWHYPVASLVVLVAGYVMYRIIRRWF